jgi:hypothetical protein
MLLLISKRVSHRMKIITYTILILCNTIVFCQDCENVLFTDDSLIQVNPRTYIINCEKIVYDTTYDFMPYKGTKYADCYKLIHKSENWIIRDFWTSNDTIYTKEYFKSGKLKRESLFYDYLNISATTYYENGQIEYGEIEKVDTLQKRPSFYKDGSLRHEGYFFAGSIYDSITTYHQNGIISGKTYLTPFSSELLGDLNYRSTEVLSEYYFDENGDTIAYPKDETLNVNVFNYQMLDIALYPINGDTYSFYHVLNQKGYSRDMNLLQKEIIKNTKFPKSVSCPIAYCYLQLTINKKGVIELDNNSLKNEEAKLAVNKAINKIGKWEIGKVNGTPVNVQIYIGLLLEFDK